MNDSEKLSAKRIREWGNENPQLHADALKILALAERLESELDPDPTNDPEYVAAAAEMAKRCQCDPFYRPCCGVLYGGVCDQNKGDPQLNFA